MGPGTGGPGIVVSVGGGTWTVPPGRQLDFGRGRDRTVRLAYEPPDEHVSRHAGTLQVDRAYVIVRNESVSRPLLLVGPAGGEHEIEPGGGTTSLPHRTFSVVVVGGYGRRYELGVDARRLDLPAAPPERPADPGAPPTTSALAELLTPGQRRLLVALCEPVLRPAAGGPRPATYRQVGELLGRQPGYVRNALRQIRETLAGAGVPGLLGDDGRSGAEDDFRLPLAQWAVRTATVTPADLADLPDR